MQKKTVLFIALTCIQSLILCEASLGNEVTILNEGYVIPIKGRELVPGLDEENGGRYVASTIGLVKGENADGDEVVVVVDPGFVGNRKWLLKALLSEGVFPRDVTHVFLSHHHPDHTINAALFPKATVVDFWAIYKNDLWEDHGDNYEIAPGIEVLRTPGHTHEDASLVVHTNNGTVVFTHVYWFQNEDGTLFPAADPIAVDPVAMEDSRDEVFDIADCIVPGHGRPFANPFKTDSVCDFGDRDDYPKYRGWKIFKKFFAW